MNISPKTQKFVSSIELILFIFNNAINKKHDFNNQKRLVKIYEELKGKDKIIEAIIGDIEYLKKLSRGLFKTLEEIKEIKENNAKFLQEIDTYEICYNQCHSARKESNYQYKIVSRIELRKIKNGNLADSAFYGGNEIQYEKYMQEDKQLEIQLTAERKKKSIVEKKYDDCLKNADQYSDNVFSSLFELCDFYYSRMKQYLKLEFDTRNDNIEPIFSETEIDENTRLFDNKLLSELGIHINGSLFEKMDELIFLLAINSDFKKLKPIENNHGRICLFINILYKRLKNKDIANKWKESILKEIGIKQERFSDNCYKCRTRAKENTFNNDYLYVKNINEVLIKFNLDKI
ncbi:hypothetical protein ACRTDU_11710 [Sunxiuqinia elliptica]